MGNLEINFMKNKLELILRFQKNLVTLLSLPKIQKSTPSPSLLYLSFNKRAIAIKRAV
jgi:hypothetical protein